MTGWVALGIAGALFYELPNKTAAFKHHKDVPDSFPMNGNGFTFLSEPLLFETQFLIDFKTSVAAFLNNPPSEEDRENARIKNIEAQISEAKKKLDPNWPPKKRPQEPSSEKSRLVFPPFILSHFFPHIPFPQKKVQVVR